MDEWMNEPGQAVAQPMTPIPGTVRRVRRETSDTFTLNIELNDDRDAFSFDPGQFNMMYAFGVGEVPISISGNPAGQNVVHTVRDVGAVTHAICKLKPGHPVGLRGPFGRGWPMEGAVGDDVIVIAGGVGLAPLRSTIYRLIHDRARYGSVSVIYGARTPADLLYVRELERWRARFDLDTAVTVDRADRNWHGHVGVVTKLIPKAAIDPAHATAFICGPEVMMRFTIRELQTLGVADDHIFISMERNMRCAIGLCGHCQFGPTLICRDGPVFSYEEIHPFFGMREF